MEGSRDLSGRNVFIVPPPRASACGLSPGLESPGPLGRRSRPPYESKAIPNGGVAKDIITVNPILSQSLHTDQGNSDLLRAAPGSRAVSVSIPPYRSAQ